MSVIRFPTALAAAIFCLSCSERPSSDFASSGRALTAGSVFLNECSAGNSGFFELVNVGPAPVDLARDPTYCFSIDDIAGGGSPKLITDANVNHAAGSTTCAAAGLPATCALLAPGERVWIGYSNVNSMTDDACRLLRHVYATTGNGCSGFYEDLDAGGPTHATAAGQCFGRQPDGAGWQLGAIPCTPAGGSNGGGAGCAVGAGCDDHNACTTGESWTSACSCTGGATVSCDDDNPCTADSCAAATGCAHARLADGTACSGGACEAGECAGAVLAPVVINEFAPGSYGWVELHNPRATSVGLGGYQIDDVAGGGGAPYNIVSGTTIPAHGFLVFNYSAFNTASRDDVRLVAANCGACSAGPGDTTTNFYAGISVSGKCFGRQPDGGAWAAASVTCSQGLTNGGGGAACTPGAPCSDGNACTTGETLSTSCACTGGAALSCDDGNACTTDTCAPASGCAHANAADGTACGSGGTCKAGVCATAEPPVVINEFQAGSNGWVELYNPRTTAADIGRYMIDDVENAGGPDYVIAAGTTIPAKGFRVFGYTTINTTSRDDVRFVASYLCGACTAGPGDQTSNFYAGSSTAGKCFGRQPDGGGWAAASIPCTPGASNGGGGQACTPGALCDDGKPCTFRTYWDSNCVCTEASPGSTLECDDYSLCTVDGCDPATGCTHTPVADGTACLGGTCKAGACVLTDTKPQVVINEFMAGDKGWIELYNLRDTTVDVSTCYVDDVKGSGGVQVQIPWGTTIPARSVKLFPYGLINTSSKDDVNFYSSPSAGCAAGIVADSHSNFYAGSSTAGKCFGRKADGSDWAAASIPCTPGALNSPP
jgi:hypothetical protein